MLASAAAGAVQPAFAFIISSFVVVFYDTDTSDIMHKASFWSWMVGGLVYVLGFHCISTYPAG